MNNREIEIDLKSLLIYLFEHWRSIIVVMLISGILGGAFGVYRAQKANSANFGNSAQSVTSVDTADNSSEKTVKDRSQVVPSSSLSAKQVADVEKAVNYMDVYYRMKDYYDSSVFLKLDASALGKGSVIMAVSSASGDNNESIKKVYESYLTSPELQTYVTDNTGYAFDDDSLITTGVISTGTRMRKNNTDLSVMFESEDNDPNNVIFSVVYTDAESCGKIVDSIIAFLSEKKASVIKAYGEHELNLIDRSVATVMDASVNDSIVNYNDKMIAYNCKALDLKGTFNSEQSSYYKELIDTLEFSDSPEAVVEKAVESVPMISLKRQGIKYGIVGLFAGAFLMACYWALIYIFRNRADLYDDISAYYGVSELGRIPSKKKEKEFIFDKWIRKWKNYPLKSEYDEAVKLCATQIHMMASKENVDDIIIISCAREFEPTGEIEKLANEVGALNIKAGTVENVLYDTEKMNRLADAKGVVLAGKSDITRRNDLFKSVDLMKRQGIKMLGGVIIG